MVSESGRLESIELSYPENFNFGYDVVDAIAGETPEKTALVCAIRKTKSTFFPSRT